MRIIDVDLSIVNDAELDFFINDDTGFDVEIKDAYPVTTSDYRKLNNLPTINGEVLLDNYDEIDPTVPEWAKQETKPDYTPDEVGAVDVNNEMSLAAVKELWDSVFA